MDFDELYNGQVVEYRRNPHNIWTLRCEWIAMDHAEFYVVETREYIRLNRDSVQWCWPVISTQDGGL